MPTYDYKCRVCGAESERTHSVSQIDAQSCDAWLSMEFGREGNIHQYRCAGRLAQVFKAAPAVVIAEHHKADYQGKPK